MDSRQLFSLYVAQGPHKGLRRFEHGTRVAEFFDLRANPRCIVEGQALHLRKIVSQINAQGWVASPADALEYRGAAGCLAFDPRDTTLRLPQWYSWGRAAGNERIAEIYAQVLGSPIIADEAEVEACAEGEDKVISKMHQVTRASWGACFVAAFLLEQGGPSACFRTCIDSLRERVAMAGSPHRPHVHRANGSLECVHEDDGDSNLTSEETLCPTTGGRPRRSLTVCVQASASTAQSLAPRERSSSVNAPTTSSCSSCGENASSTTSVRSSPRKCSLPAVPLAPQSTPVVSLTPPVEEQSSARSGRSALQLGEPDEDMWQFYGSMLEEYIRLSDMIDETVCINQSIPY